jgi:folate-binding Fe-S cluster repair protein YgfZ
MGQENTARQYFRGAVRKRVTPFITTTHDRQKPWAVPGMKIVNARGDAVGDVIAALRARNGEEIGLMRARMNFVREHFAGTSTLAFETVEGGRHEIIARAPEWWPESYSIAPADEQ